jgi:hypothetical protein
MGHQQLTVVSRRKLAPTVNRLLVIYCLTEAYRMFLYNFREAALLVIFQIGVKAHADIPYQQSTRRKYGNPVIFDF